MTYTVTATQIIILVMAAVWELIWKGLALWRAAHHSQRYWFVALLVINSVGILPIVYMMLVKPDNKPT